MNYNIAVVAVKRIFVVTVHPILAVVNFANLHICNSYGLVHS